MKSKHFDSYIQCVNFKTDNDKNSLSGLIMGLIYELEEKNRDHLKKEDYKDSIFLSMINPNFESFRNVAFALFLKNYKSPGRYQYVVLQYQYECYHKELQKFPAGFQYGKYIQGICKDVDHVYALSDEIYGAESVEDLKERIANYKHKKVDSKQVYGIDKLDL